MVTIRELAETVGFRGSVGRKIAEPSQVKTLPVIDNSVPTQSNITTSLDCYVSGQYVQRNGGVIEVTQRYQIFVSYAKSTQQISMQEIRNRIISDFEQKYGTNFNVTNTFVPALMVPVAKQLPGTPSGQSAPIELYQGSGLFRQMTRYERVRYEIGTQREMAQTNIGSIKKRYSVR